MGWPGGAEVTLWGSGNEEKMNKFDALKDDDSGDHDQNEEIAHTKMVRRKKTEWDKSQSSGRRKADVPGPAEQPLQHSYTFWNSRRISGRPTSSQSYEQNIKQMGTFASQAVQGVLQLYGRYVPGTWQATVTAISSKKKLNPRGGWCK